MVQSQLKLDMLSFAFLLSEWLVDGDPFGLRYTQRLFKVSMLVSYLIKAYLDSLVTVRLLACHSRQVSVHRSYFAWTSGCQKEAMPSCCIRVPRENLLGSTMRSSNPTLNLECIVPYLCIDHTKQMSSSSPPSTTMVLNLPEQ